MIQSDMPTDSQHIQDFVKNELTLNFEPSYISDKTQLQAKIYKLLTPRWFRFRSVEPDIETYLKEKIGEYVEAGSPIKILNACGGFKNHRIDTAPHIDYAEVFHLAFFTKTLQRICEIYEPGIHLEYSGDCHAACIADNVKKESVDTYVHEFNLLLEHFGSITASNFTITHKHFLDFYDFDTMRKDINDRAAQKKLDSKENMELIQKYYHRAKSNFVFDGFEDYTDLSDEEKDMLIKTSIIKTYTWYDVDFEHREDYFNSYISLVNLQEFPEAYCVRSVRYLPAPVFWQGKGVIKEQKGKLHAAILHVDQYIASRDQFEKVPIEKPPLDIESLQSIYIA